MLTDKQQDEKKIARLQAALDAALELIADIRYQEWPKILHEGQSEIMSHRMKGMDAERMDVILREGELAVRASKRKNRTA